MTKCNSLRLSVLLSVLLTLLLTAGKADVVYAELVDGKLLIPSSIYLNTAQYDNLKSYEAYTQGQEVLKKEDPKSYALLESSSRRGCNQAKMLFANCMLPKDHPLKIDGLPTFVLEGKNLNDRERMQRYLKWMNSAAENGSSTAAKSLAELYREGKHVGKDSNYIFKYTKLAAQSNDPEYMYRLGVYYSQGIGCAKDSANAEKWMKQAAHSGSNQASAWLNERRERERKVTAQSYSHSEDTSYDNMVWISETGSKYHRYSSCGRMNPSRAHQMSQSQAEASGYSACKRCY
ncbi:MAG: hypothetical protein K6A35_08760 [bacterium]|nr:hypothetical protein [bacterium]